MRIESVLLGAFGVIAMFTVAPVAGADPGTPPPAPDQVVTDSAVPADAVAAPVEIPHLSSPENLPPGTSDDPLPEGRRLGYLRDLWHAVQTQEISGGDALLLLTQRSMDPNSGPPVRTPDGPPPAPVPDAAVGDAPVPAPS